MIRVPRIRDPRKKPINYLQICQRDIERQLAKRRSTHALVETQALVALEDPATVLLLSMRPRYALVDLHDRLVTATLQSETLHNTSPLSALFR